MSSIVNTSHQDGRQELKQESLPRHVAIIMDGNGRWAKKRHLPRLAGHRAGTNQIRKVVEAFAARGIKLLSLYAFSTENWSRPSQEIRGLMNLLRQVLDREVPELHRQGVRLLHVGRSDRLSPDLVEGIEKAVQLTRHNDRITVCVCLDYGGRDEILEAVRHIVRDGIPPDSIDEALFSRYLLSHGAPDPDLIIRTGGEQRLSNFLIWQSAYSEFYTTPTLWPDFGPEDIDQALAEFSHRQRRFGGLSPGG